MNTIRGLSPIIDAYLDELDAATAHLPADERYDIRSSIEEHIADRLAGHNVTDDDARRVVRELGPVSSIVPPTTESMRPEFVPMTATAAQPMGHLGRNALICAVISLVTIPLVPIAIALGIAAIVMGVLGLRRRQQQSLAVVALVIGIGTGLIIPTTLLAWHNTTGSSHSAPATSTRSLTKLQL